MKVKIISTEENISEINNSITSTEIEKGDIATVKDIASFGFDVEILNQIMLSGNFAFMIGNLSFIIYSVLKARNNQKIIVKTPIKTINFETTEELTAEQIQATLEELIKPK